MSTETVPLILVVDDYQDAREMYAEYLQFSGFRVAEARNGNEALEQAFALKPDLILMDLSLPGMDGWEATRPFLFSGQEHPCPGCPLRVHQPRQFLEHWEIQALRPIAHRLQGIGVHLNDQSAGPGGQGAEAERRYQRA